MKYDNITRSVWNRVKKAIEKDLDLKLDKADSGKFTAFRYITVKYDYNDSVLPQAFVLKKNYPNPFNPVTNIEIQNDVIDHVRLIIYDINGRYVASLLDGPLNVGNYTYQWDGKDSYGHSVASGMYICTLNNSTSIQTQKMLLLK